MEATTVIRKPLITEKTTFHSSELNRYAFEVDRRATKTQIKRAVEEIYKVRVVKVATQNRKGQLRRNRYGFWRSREMKPSCRRSVHDSDPIRPAH